MDNFTEQARAIVAEREARFNALPRTKEGWTPFTHFENDFFSEDEPFLVWLGPVGTFHLPVFGIVCMAEVQFGELKCIGDWLYDPKTELMEPIAFMPMPETGDIAELERISA